jgi:hypothetical protein
MIDAKLRVLPDGDIEIRVKNGARLLGNPSFADELYAEILLALRAEGDAMGGPCWCGSGLPQRELFDARRIYCGRVCDKCEDGVKAKYRPEIFTDPNYETDEPIEDEG